MADSFVFYRSFHEAIAELPREQYGNILFAVNEYALNGVEPELSGVEKTIFTLIKPQIDANNRRKSGGALGGRPKKNKKPMVIEKETIGFENKNHRFSNEKPNVNDNVNSNVNENLNDNANLNAESRDFAPSENGTEYAKSVFDAFRSAGLPCCKENFTSFMQKDFALALPYLRGVSSKDVIAAAQNYASIFQKSSTTAFWKKQKASFDRFAEKKIRDFLPENFCPEKYESETERRYGGL